MTTRKRTFKRNKWQELRDYIQAVFTPQAPINKRELFVGRVSQIGKMLDAIKQLGAHAIVYGERGVGKTSLVTILPPLLEHLKYAGLVISKTQCDVNDTYGSICRKLLSNLAVTESKMVIADSTKKLPLPDTLDLWLSSAPTPDEMRRLILTLGERKLIGIIDEFDAVAGKSEVVNLIANTIKTLSDTLSPATLILVGIADTVEGLIAEHASIDRCLVEIPIPRMSTEEMKGIMKTNTKEVGMSIDSNAELYIRRIAQGLPSYVHLLGRESAIVAANNEETKISKSHVEEGIQNALSLVPGILMQDWEKAMASTKPNNLFKQVLLACAFAQKNELGFFTAKNVKEPFCAIMHKKYEIPGYGGSLHLLTEARRASILEKQGESHRWRYRFRNPLMEPYTIMYGLSSNLIDETTVTSFRQNSA